MLKLPYGLADFPTLRRDGYVYIDRTMYLRVVEEMGRSLLFIRPRRFGKSLWLRTLAAYYDLRTADQHDEIFGGLAVGAEPTPEAHRYFVLSWDFSLVTPRGSVAEVASSLNDYVNTTLGVFVSEYREHLSAVTMHDDARNTLQEVLAAVRRAGHPLYLLVDEYDNFANEVMVHDGRTYSDLVHGDGPYKELMKTVKAATQGQGLERLFVTGISPMVMSDLSSGMNILTDVYQEPELGALCGFRDPEIEDLLRRLRSEAENAGRRPSWTLEEASRTIRDWYNGYRFSPLSEERVYNPTMTLYYLRHLQRHGESPRQLLDANLAADEDKLGFVAEAVAGRQSLIDRLQDEKPLEISALAGRFKLRDIVEHSGDEVFLASFLTYFGMLTLGGESPTGNLRLVTPNLVVRKLYVDQVRRLLVPKSRDQGDAQSAALAMTEEGRIEPLVSFVEEKIFPVMSNRDYRWMDEHALKMTFLTLLFNDITHLVVSESELGRGYADLCLLRRFDRRFATLYDLLFEFKYLGLAELGTTGGELRDLESKYLGELQPVRRQMKEAKKQLGHYRAVLEGRYEGLRLRSFAVVALGFERLVVEELAND